MTLGGCSEEGEETVETDIFQFFYIVLNEGGGRNKRE